MPTLPQKLNFVLKVMFSSARMLKFSIFIFYFPIRKLQFAGEFVAVGGKMVIQRRSLTSPGVTLSNVLIVKGLVVLEKYGPWYKIRVQVLVAR